MSFPTFEEFYRAVFDRPPFSWQSRYASRKGFADVAMPTGTGKTAIVVIWCWKLAKAAFAGDSLPPRRLCYVVDRRIVIDSAYDEAVFLTTALATATGGPIKVVADALRSLGGEKPLLAARLRGATWRDDRWLESPLQPLVLTSTVDQAGSRLLGRGYGCSPANQVVACALLGNDCLWVIDEAHISKPMADTLRAAIAMHGANEAILPAPQLVEMTATPEDLANAEQLQPEDIKPGTVLHQRLTSSKPTRLKSVATKKLKDTEGRKLVIDELTSEAQRLNGEVIGVVCNRVDIARGVFEALNKPEGRRAILLTGQVRPHERDQLLREHNPTIKAGRKANPTKKLYVVATQCIEVGADLDFDAMVTECAPLDTLKQRFGRLNRMGRDIEANAVIVSRDDHRKKDFLYGDAIGNTWTLLQSVKKTKKNLDFGILAAPEATDPNQLSPRPTYRQLLATDVEQAADVNLPLSWSLGEVLHGMESAPDVSLCWRDDLGEYSHKEQSRISAIVDALPPSPSECMSQRKYRVGKWLGQRHVFVYRYDWQGFTTADGLQAGDLVVLPANYGGCDRYGWNPQSKDPVEDIGDDAAWRATGRYVKRFRDNADLDDGEVHESINTTAKRKVEAYPNGILVTSKSPAPYPGDPPRLFSVRSTGRKVHLSDHCRDVGHWAGQFAPSPTLKERFQLAGECHDFGKLDPRWQYAIAGGAILNKPLAKGEVSIGRFVAAARQVGLPAGWRHETLSVLIAESITDDDFILHLVASHHGRAHPLIGVVEDDSYPPVTATDIAGHRLNGVEKRDMVDLVDRCANRFAKIQNQFGMWQRCYLEAVLIFADRTQSKLEALS